MDSLQFERFFMEHENGLCYHLSVLQNIIELKQAMCLGTG
jgi:hypothetical protein